MLIAIWKYLEGKKTYCIAVSAFCSLAIARLNNTIDTKDFIRDGVALAISACIRSGVNKKDYSLPEEVVKDIAKTVVSCKNEEQEPDPCPPPTPPAPVVSPVTTPMPVVVPAVPVPDVAQPVEEVSKKEETPIFRVEIVYPQQDKNEHKPLHHKHPPKKKHK